VKKIIPVEPPPPPLSPPIVVPSKGSESVEKFRLSGSMRRYPWNCHLCRAENPRYINDCANCKRRKEVKLARWWLDKKNNLILHSKSTL
jgi:hypothetical protein